MSRYEEERLFNEFAAAALTGILSGTQGASQVDASNPVLVAKAAWEYAAQMIVQKPQ